MYLLSQIVIGNVARFKIEKNHTFQIEIMKEITRIRSDIVLMLVGDGELRQKIEEQVKQLHLEQNVIFLGVRSDVPDLMQAMDLFLLPSLYEGLPVVGIEAQAAGLPVITSTGVTRETDITGNVDFLNLDLGAAYWAQAILQKIEGFNRHDMYEYIHNNGYDIVETAKWLQDFYIRKHFSSKDN